MNRSGWFDSWSLRLFRRPLSPSLRLWCRRFSAMVHSLGGAFDVPVPTGAYVVFYVRIHLKYTIAARDKVSIRLQRILRAIHQVEELSDFFTQFASRRDDRTIARVRVYSYTVRYYTGLHLEAVLISEASSEASCSDRS